MRAERSSSSFFRAAFAVKAQAAILLLACLVALPAEAASAIEVAHGCDVPNASNGGRTFFVDPAGGSKENDGSEAKPWRTLRKSLTRPTTLLRPAHMSAEP